MNRISMARKRIALTQKIEAYAGVALLVGTVGGLVYLYNWGEERRRADAIREFYQNMDIDTVRHADGSIDTDNTTVRINLKNAEILRKKVQPE